MGVINAAVTHGTQGLRDGGTPLTMLVSSSLKSKGKETLKLNCIHLCGVRLEIACDTPFRLTGNMDTFLVTGERVFS